MLNLFEIDFRRSLLTLFWGAIQAFMVLAAVVSTGDNIAFDVDDSGNHEMRLDGGGLGIGTNLIPAANLHVGGNALITGALSVGSTSSSSSNLYLSGTIGYGYETLTSSGNIDEYSVVMAGNSSGNITLTLPGAWDVGDGRIYEIKKNVSENEITIKGGGQIDGSPVGVLMNSGNLGSLEVVSYESAWYLLGSQDADVIQALFYEDFEDPAGVATSDAHTSKQTPSNWVRATSGFGADRHGIIDRLTSNFSPDDPNDDQGYAFRYSNSGFTTAENVIGTFQANVTYRVSFKVLMDISSANVSYSAELMSFSTGVSRNDVRSTPAGANLHASTSGSAPTDGTFETVTFEYTVDPVIDAASLGDDLAVRFKGATSSATIDEVIVYIP
jgi:hypothetical protein